MASRSFSLPLFPLGIFLLPGERTGLHIFEPRYRQLVAELEAALTSGQEEANRFGIPFHFEEVTARTGCLARLVEVKKVHPGGRKDIVVECVGHFEATRFLKVADPKLYPSGEVVERDIRLSEPLSKEQKAAVAHIKTLLEQRPDVDVSLLAGDTIEDLTSWLGLPPAQKHRLLVSSGKERIAFIDGVLRWTALVLQQEVHIKDGFFPN